MSDEADSTIDAEPITPPVQTIEHWRESLQVPLHRHRGAARLHGWGVGRELTEADYRAGIDAFANHTVKGA